MVLAELRGKLDPLSNDPVDRSEDLLTDAVFGAVRHLPRVEVLGRLLEEVGVRLPSKDLAKATVWLWPTIPASQWTGSFVEPDVLVIAGKRTIVFEAKLHSSFGQYRELDGGGRSLHQLAVQYAAVRSWALGHQLDPPIVVAVTPSAEPPPGAHGQATADIHHLVPEADGGSVLRWLPWRTIGEILGKAEGLRIHEHVHVEDVLALMDKRGVLRVFKGFQREDYWLLAAAQRVAAQRVYPEIQTFIEDLAAVLAKDAIPRSLPGTKWVWVSSSIALYKPTDWTRSFIGAQFWPEDWPQRGKLGNYLAIYGVFDFVEPAFEVGLSIPGPGAAVAQQKFAEHLDAVAAQVRGLPHGFEMAFDSSDLARPVAVVSTEDLDAAWLETRAKAAVATSHLRLRRRSDPLSLTVQHARELVGSVRQAVDQCPALWDMLRSSGHLN